MYWYVLTCVKCQHMILWWLPKSWPIPWLAHCIHHFQTRPNNRCCWSAIYPYYPHILCHIYISCLVVYLPLWNIWIRQLGVWNSQYMESDKIPWFQTTNQYIPFIDSWSMSCLWSFLWRWWIYHPFFAAWPSLIRKMMDHQGSDFDIKNHDMENPLWMEVSSWENHL